MGRLRGTDAMLLGTIVIWALNVTVTRYVLTHGFRPLAYSSIRYAGAAVLTVGAALALERSLAVGGAGSIALLALAAIVLFLNQIAFVYSLKLATATTVALIMGTTPVFTALAAFVVGLERPSWRLWLGALITFGGVALVAVGGGGNLSSDLGGDLLAVGLAASWAVYSVMIAPLMRRHSPYRISAIILLATLLPILLVSARQLRDQDFGALGWPIWLGLAYAIVGPLALTNLLWYTAIDRVGPSRATLFANFQPFLAAIIAALVLSEHLSALEIAGGLAIVAGILLERRHPAVAAPPAE